MSSFARTIQPLPTSKRASVRFRHNCEGGRRNADADPIHHRPTRGAGSH